MSESESGEPGGGRAADGASQPRHLPWKGTVVAVACVLFIILTGPARPLPSLCSPCIIPFLISVLLFPFMFWALAFAIDLRKAPQAWRIGSWILISAFAVSANVVNAKRWEWKCAAVREDWESAIRELHQPQSGPRAENESAGPFTRIMTNLVDHLNADKLAYEDAKRRTGLLDLDARVWRKSSPVFRRCGQVAALQAQANAVGDRGFEHLAEMRQMAAAAVKRHEIDPRAALAFVNMVDARGHQQAWRAEGETTQKYAVLCTVLSQTSWTAADGRINFARRQDYLAYQHAYLPLIDAIGVPPDVGQQAKSLEGSRR